MTDVAICQDAGLSDDEITALIDDPAKIESHEVALEVVAVLDAEIANIQAQVDAAVIEANVRPLSPERQAWLRRATYAGAMRRNERHRVMQRDKELRGVKGNATTEPKHTKEEKRLKQERLLVEAQDRRLKRQLAVESERAKQMEIAERRRSQQTEIQALRAKLARPEVKAASDLLEALIAVVAVADRKTVEFDAARAAIAKATDAPQR